MLVIKQKGKSVAMAMRSNQFEPALKNVGREAGLIGGEHWNYCSSTTTAFQLSQAQSPFPRSNHSMAVESVHNILHSLRGWHAAMAMLVSAAVNCRLLLP